MHILLVNRWFPPEGGWGGVGMYNATMARAYRALGHQVTVIASRGTAAAAPEEITPEGVRVQRLWAKDAYRLRKLPVLGRYVRPLQLVQYSRAVDAAVRRLAAREMVDVIEFADVGAEAFFFSRAPVAPYLVRCHTPTFVLRRYYTRGEMPYDTALTSWCERQAIRRAPALTTPSADMARVIVEDCRIPQARITVVPNALDLREFLAAEPLAPEAPPPSDCVTVLHVGRLERAKGVEVLVEAIPHVLRQAPETRFVFVGADRPTANGSSERAELSARLAAAGALSNVTFLGALDHAALLAQYRQADLCVVPSVLYESFSYTVAQAMAAGRAVVTTRIGGIPETVDGGACGVLTEPGNAGDLAEAIVKLVKDPARRADLGRAGRARVEREYDAGVVAEKNLKVYEVVRDARHSEHSRSVPAERESRNASARDSSSAQAPPRNDS